MEFGKYTVGQKRQLKFFLYASITDCLISTDQPPGVMLREERFSDEEISYLEECAALESVSNEQSVEDLYLEKSLYDSLQAYVDLDHDGLVSETVVHSLERTNCSSITWVQAENGLVNSQTLNHLQARISGAPTHRLVTEVETLTSRLSEPLLLPVYNIRIGSDLALSNSHIEALAQNLKHAKSVTLTVRMGVDAERILQDLLKLANLLPDVEFGVQEDRVPGSLRNTPQNQGLYRIARRSDLAVRNAVVGGRTRPLGCPAALPDVIHIDMDGTVRKCPVAGAEGVLGQATGGRLELDRNVVATWAKANGYRNKRQECLSCAILPRCFGETCPRSVLTDGRNHCLCPDGRLLEDELRPSPANSDTSASWLPNCRPRS